MGRNFLHEKNQGFLDYMQPLFFPKLECLFTLQQQQVNINKKQRQIEFFLKHKSDDETSQELLVFSPRSLHLLSQLDLLTAIAQRGIRHYKFDVYRNKGQGNHAVTDQKSLRLWENESTEYNYSISCSKSVVIDILKEYLEKVQGIVIDVEQEIIHIEERNQTALSSKELSLYYQYRPLPTIHQTNDRIMKSVHLQHKKTKQVQVWKALTIIGADGQTSLVRQKLGTFFSRLYFP